jgi:hypothetical protein
MRWHVKDNDETLVTRLVALEVVGFVDSGPVREIDLTCIRSVGRTDLGIVGLAVRPSQEGCVPEREQDGGGEDEPGERGRLSSKVADDGILGGEVDPLSRRTEREGRLWLA